MKKEEINLMYHRRETINDDIENAEEKISELEDTYHFYKDIVESLKGKYEGDEHYDECLSKMFDIEDKIEFLKLKVEELEEEDKEIESKLGAYENGWLNSHYGWGKN